MLCEQAFRDTLLRRVLASTSTIDNGRALIRIGSPAALEALVSQRSDDRVSAAIKPRQGFALDAGVTGPNGISFGVTNANIVALAEASDTMLYHDVPC